MGYKKFISQTVAAGVTLSMLWGCSDHDRWVDAPHEVADPMIAITLRLPVDSDVTLTRSYPTGGEDGDGREAGLDYENSVADANIYFFNADGFNVPDAEAEETEVTGIYVAGLTAAPSESDENPFEKKITVKVRIAETDLEESGILSSTGVGFVTVLNAGADLSSEIRNLKDLREYDGFSSTWKETGGVWSDFLMTTAYDAGADGKVNVDGTPRYVGSNRIERNSKAGIEATGIEWIGEATVQRLCARVDLMYKEENVREDELVFPTPAGSKVHLTNIHPVNFMEKPSYLLTKVTAGIPATWTASGVGEISWGGIQKVAAGSDLPVNYVIEPTTFAKVSENADLQGWYGVSAASAVTTALQDGSAGKIGGYRAGTIPAGENVGCDRISIIGYANENTQPQSCYTSDFITGLAFRALFQPVSICRKVEGEFRKFPLTDEEWEEKVDKTIWRYQPSEGANGVSEEYSLYFETEAEMQEYLEEHTADLAIVTKFEDGVCYYNLWLRHYNDESYKTSDSAIKGVYPMEYVTVRNNIYRVSVSFSGAGWPDPQLREPDTMKSRIFVRKWNKRLENAPLQF